MIVVRETQPLHAPTDPSRVVQHRAEFLAKDCGLRVGHAATKGRSIGAAWRLSGLDCRGVVKSAAK
jgi:hypothetical protein